MTEGDKNERLIMAGELPVTFYYVVLLCDASRGEVPELEKRFPPGGKNDLLWAWSFMNAGDQGGLLEFLEERGVPGEKVFAGLRDPIMAAFSSPEQIQLCSWLEGREEGGQFLVRWSPGDSGTQGPFSHHDLE